MFLLHQKIGEINQTSIELKLDISQESIQYRNVELQKYLC